MPRRKCVAKREVSVDPKYGDVLLQKFINKIMLQGKKSVAETIVYSAIETAAQGKKEGPVEVFKLALDNIRPQVMVKSTRLGGATYQVPTEVSLENSQAIGMKWIITFSRKRAEKGMAQKLAAELDDAFNKRGNSFKRKEETLRMAEANKAFAHFKW
ncbi:30S ribosomal protein S7 [bacterium]|jgi:small subunit ribosomal protein S7|nr:30S ribosomal protein S7 [bacterium]MBR6244032.1 30S ribosomal protein S7 [bacterium]